MCSFTVYVSPLWLLGVLLYPAELLWVPVTFEPFPLLCTVRHQMPTDLHSYLYHLWVNFFFFYSILYSLRLLYIPDFGIYQVKMYIFLVKQQTNT